MKSAALLTRTSNGPVLGDDPARDRRVGEVGPEDALAGPLLLLEDVEPDDPMAARRERLGDGPADAARAPGDERDARRGGTRVGHEGWMTGSCGFSWPMRWYRSSGIASSDL